MIDTDEVVRTRVQWHRGSSRVLRVLGLLAAMAVIPNCASNSNQKGAGGADANAGGKTTMWGYVWTINGKDTARVVHAQVWTEPISDVVFTDTSGYWEIKEGIAENKYRVRAKFNDVNGQTEQFTIKRGEGTKADIVLGVEVTAWPPTISLENKAVSIPAGIPIRRLEHQ